MPFPSIISSLDWCANPWDQGQVGEVYGADRIYNGLKAATGSGRGHICGTETDFYNGALYNPALPPVTYDANGLPDCCHPPRAFPAGLEFSAITYVSSSSGSGAYPMPFTNFGVSLFASWLFTGVRPGLNNLYLHLFTNNYNPRFDTTLGDLVEASYPGYAPQLIQDANWLDLGASGGAEELYSPNITPIPYYTWSTLSGSESATGSYITLGLLGEVIAAALFTGTPILIQPPPNGAAEYLQFTLSAT